MGRILNNDKIEYKKEIGILVTWCQANNLSLNVSKIKEIMLNFRKQSDKPQYIEDAEAESKFLRINITNHLSWTSHIKAMAKKTHQQPYLLRRLRHVPNNHSQLLQLHRR